MQTASAVQLLVEMYCPDIRDYNGDVEKLFEYKCQNIFEKVTFTYDDVCNKLIKLNAFDCVILTNEWKYLGINFYLLEMLKNELDPKQQYLGVRDAHQVKLCLQNLVSIGICKNLLMTLPYHEKFQSDFLCNDIQYNYDILKFTTNAFYLLSRSRALKVLFLTDCLNAILTAMYQIAFCPLKRPGPTECVLQVGKAQMDYFKLLQEQEQFRTNLIVFEQSLHPIMCTRAIMHLFTQKIPLWLRRQLSKKLTAIMRSHGGIKRISSIMLEGFDDDVTKTWNITDVLTRLVLSLRHAKDFGSNILPQLLTILDIAGIPPDTGLLERFVINVTHKLASSAPCMFLNIIIPRFLQGWTRLTIKNRHIRNSEDVTSEVSQAVRLLCNSFVESKHFYPVIAHAQLKEIIKVVFTVYVLTIEQTELVTVHKEIGRFLFRFLRQFSYLALTQYLACLIFDKRVAGVCELKKEIKLLIGPNGRIIMELSFQSFTFSVIRRLDCMLKFFDTTLKAHLFIFLMKCVMESEKEYYIDPRLLLSAESSAAYLIERFIATHTTLTKLSKDPEVIKVIKTNPDLLIKLIQRYLNKSIEKGVHKSVSGEGTDLFFAVLMIIDTLVMDSSEEACQKYVKLREIVFHISMETTNREVKKYCDQIVNSLATRKQNLSETKRATEYEVAIGECYDVNLPIRAKGLVALTKLIEKKDPQTMSKSQFLLTLFQVFLQDNDSYIYLNTVKAMAALGTETPFTVLRVLCEQFSSYVPKEDGVNPQEVRMKLGEVLVRIISKLGELTVQYKAMLLNTFLEGTRDDDHLIRSSSLSNLGEVCEALGYKLGSISSDIMVCVNRILESDPAPEPRRAAVFVLTKMMKGLSMQTLMCLQNEMHSIYLTLRTLYKEDRDDIVRLQAQLALEYLNDNVAQILRSNARLQYNNSPARR